MAENPTIRLNKVLRELNISLDRAVDYLNSEGHEIEARPTTKISNEVYQVLLDEFQTDKSKKVASKEVGEEKRKEKEELRLERERELEEKQKKEEASRVIKAEAKLEGPKQVGKIDLNAGKIKKEEPKPEEKPVETKIETKPEVVTEKPEPEIKKEENKPKITASPITEKPEKSTEEVKEIPTPKEEPAKETPKASDTVTTQYRKLEGPNFTGQKIDLTQFKKPEKKKETKPDDRKDKKGKRRRISKETPQGGGTNFRDNRSGDRKSRSATPKEEPSEEEVQKQVRETLEKLQGKSSKGKGAKYRREKRDTHRQKFDELAQQEAENKLIKVTEFVTASEMATMMDVPVTKIISACMSLGMMVTMNQRLDAETLSIVAEEFGYEVEFVTADIEESIERETDSPEDLEPRAPIVTVMGHVDHGKTSLLDYIRKENVIAGESGGITQHIGAYGVKLDNGQKMAFLDTPGHEAFTAMRARGAQVTDLAIIVVAADDDVMPQTKEAINHAQAAGIPMIFAINKIDKEAAKPEKIKEQLAQMNILVEDWGGKFQSQEISAKKGLNIEELLEKVLLEAEVLELKANPNKNAIGTVIESTLDKGRGYVTTIIVEAGTLKVGDIVLAGHYTGRVKAMYNERGVAVKTAGPSIPVSMLGLNGPPSAGDRFNVLKDEREARGIATRREQLQREQGVRTQKHITLDEIGRRIAIGDFKELNIILKGDVDGSVEALADSLQKLSTEKIAVNVIHKAVGQITESDVLLATASDAIIVGFQVRPSGGARRLAEKEEIQIKIYSIIYAAIEDVKAAMEGMLSAKIEEKIIGNAEIRETFKISKVGTIAGCIVTDGKITRHSKIRVIRDGIVAYTGELGSLKRFKDDVKEVTKGYECGLNVEKYNDIKVGDIIEAFEEIEVKQTLAD